MAPTPERTEQIAALYADHHETLRRAVHARSAGLSPSVVEDACAFAWLQLLTHEHIDVDPPHAGPLAWLTTTATREAWRMKRTERRATPLEHDVLDAAGVDRGHTGASAGDVAEQHLRLDLIEQIPERPRRFLLRLALGYSYDEIGAIEGACYTTVNKQIVRAKRLLREFEAEPRGGVGVEE
jgi:DNA-directed RNA polymerase specialized sigma24 family protein